MSQLPLFEESASSDLQPQTVSKSKIKAKSRSCQPKQSNSSAPKRIASPTFQLQVDVQPKHELEEKPAPYGLCQVCGSPIAIPGLNASLCSNIARTCGSSGWVTNAQCLAESSPRSGQGGAA